MLSTTTTPHQTNQPMLRKKFLLCTFLSLWLSLPAIQAQPVKPITLEAIYRDGVFSPKSVYGVNWMNNGQYYTSLSNTKSGSYIIKYNVTTGLAVDTLLTPQGLTPKGGTKPLVVDDYQLSADEKKVLVSTQTQSIYRHSYVAEYYVYDLPNNTLAELSGGGKESYATFSPDGSKVAFVRDNNLYFVDLTNNNQKRVTTTGKINEIIHGTTDWVYEEEFSFVKGFEWAPDGSKIAYYTFDERAVKEYNMQIWGPLYPIDYKFKYPKAGEANSTLAISVYHLNNEKSVKMDIGGETDIYIPRINWTENPDLLSIRRMNRLQNQLDLLHANANTGESKVILTEKSEAYVDLEFIDDLTYLANNKHFIFSSERDGYKHIYLYDMNGKLIRQITKGNWEVSEFLGIDEKSDLVYFTSTEVSPLERHLFSINIQGKNKKRLTEKSGTHQIDFSPDFTYYLDYFSDANTPLVVSLHKAPSGKLIKVLESNKELQENIAQYGFNKKELFQFTTSQNVTLNGWMIKPDNFDPNKKYPVLMFVYGGPGHQTVKNSWDTRDLPWFQLLAQKGFIVVSVDNRGTGARGAQFRQLTYGNLGKLEVQDQIEGAKHLGSLPFVDKNLIGIYGWSYGGYMASLTMTLGAEYFAAGIAGAPVTNWRFYDTIYTERYLKTPQENPQGYDAYSPINHVSKLKDPFLLIHGTGDDNVHFQNSVALQDALINAGKQFESFYYPNQSHGVRGKARLHLHQLMTNFLEKHLKPGSQS